MACAILGCIGCAGACTGNAVLLNIYFSSLLISALLEAGIVCYGYGDKDNVNYKVTVQFNQLFEKYNTGKGNEVEFIAVHRVQSGLRCCGISGARYWNNKTMFGVDKVPGSCCWGYDINEDVRGEGEGKWEGVYKDVQINQTVNFSNGTSYVVGTKTVQTKEEYYGSTCEKIDAHDIGCGEMSDELIDNFLLGIALVLLLSVGAQIVGMILACYSKRDEEEYKEMRGGEGDSVSVYPGSPMAMRHGASPGAARRCSDEFEVGEGKKSFSSYPESRQSSYRGTYL